MNIKFIIVGLMLSLSSLSYGEDYVKYSSYGNFKSQGVVVDFTYPSGWKKEGSDKPHTVNKFIKNNLNHKIIFLVQVLTVPQATVGQMRSMSLSEHAKLIANIGKVYGDVKTKVSNLDGYKADVVMKEGDGASSSIMRVNIINVLVNDKWLGFWCGVTTKSNTSAKDLEVMFANSQKECNQIFSTIEVN